ncbi:MAG TPA: ribonuclease HII [Rhodospirillaceae bacterium]|nr:ribonuclease HII [Rhodospirillaceae bacterium]HAA92132.1 ribonuclease HII [Rhodospirillaceae bacterium]HAT36427.1 ribonuclease HII [Rhodospirillaceae bacterium]|tara:strand:+ start:225 stop:827 length:603 start_codon:yes stop_codon:yes gene_type:complete
MPDFSREIALGGTVAGIDEVGRGPWAGPVVAAAVILDRSRVQQELLLGLDDSKKLTAKKREALFVLLPECAEIGLGRAEVDEIDTLNILQASLLAMRRAYDALSTPPQSALVDGNRAPDLPCFVETIVKGDGRSLSIAAASIVAKVSRDREMAELATSFPGYGWERNAGYGTKQHREALAELGVTPHHRKSFAPIAALLA